MLRTNQSSNDHESVLSQAAALKVTGNKEAVLRKLLETQDTYIHELEAKCKAMTAQLLSGPDSQSMGKFGRYVANHGTHDETINLS